MYNDTIDIIESDMGAIDVLENDNDTINLCETTAGGDKNFLYTQTIASDTWSIQHNLNKYPSVSVIDSAGDEVIGEVEYNTINKVTISFKGAFKGTATLN